MFGYQGLRCNQVPGNLAPGVHQASCEEIGEEICLQKLPLPRDDFQASPKPG